MSNSPLKGSSLLNVLKESRVRTVVALPDIVTCENMLWPIAKDDDFRLVPVCKEDEGVSICAALSYCNERAILLIQHTGFLDSVNAIRVIAVEYSLPIVMFVGLQGMEYDRIPTQSASLGIRILQPLCESMKLQSHVLTFEEDVAVVKTTIESSYEHSKPFVFFIARSPE